MATLEITIDDNALEQAERIAHSNHLTVQQWASNVIRQQVHTKPDSLLGFLAEDEEAAEAIEDVVKARVARPMHNVDFEEVDA